MPITKQLPETLLDFPRKVQIEPVGQCNLRCTMCALPFRAPAGRPAFMDFALFKELVAQFRGVEELHLQGLGEPLLHPSFFAMISHAARSGVRVTTNSNMTLLTPDRAEECVRSGLSWVRVSIDGATRATYGSIRAGGSLDTVLENLAALRRAKEKLGSARPRLFLAMVLMRQNVSETADVVRLAHEYGMEQVFVQHLCNDLSGNTLPGQYQALADFVKQQSLAEVDPCTVQGHFNRTIAEAGRLGIELRLPHVGIYRPRAKQCDWPWRAAYFAYDGTAMPCCMIGLPERFNFGSAAKQRFMSIWNGEAYRSFRSQLRSDEPPSVCRTCSLYHGTF